MPALNPFENSLKGDPYQLFTFRFTLIQMHIPKNYFHDRVVLLLISVNTFLTLLSGVLVLLNIDFNRPDGYIVQYRANLGLSAYKAGSSLILLSFIGFALAVMVLHTLLSMKMYAHRRSFAIAALGMGLMLLIITLFVSNALLEI
jgi:hypothetical protein